MTDKRRIAIISTEHDQKTYAVDGCSGTRDRCRICCSSLEVPWTSPKIPLLDKDSLDMEEADH